MSGAVKDDPKAPSVRQRSDTIHVALRSPPESVDFTVSAGSTVGQVRRPNAHTGLTPVLGFSVCKMS